MTLSAEELFEAQKEHPIMQMAVLIASASIKGGAVQADILKDALIMVTSINTRISQKQMGDQDASKN